MLRARGGTYTRTARTRVVPQSLFHPEARGVVWDTSKVLHHYPPGYHVGAATQLFASVALMFWYVLQLFMSRD